MNEASILQSLFEGIDAVLVVFSTFFAIVSGYVNGLYFFLARAPLLKSVDFSLLSIGLLFLKGTVTVIQRLQEGLFVAWENLERSMVPMRDLRNPIPGLHLAGFTQQELGVGIGWPDDAPRGKHPV